MAYWSQPLRVETPEFVCFNTSRTINSALWFINNEKLEHHTLGYLAKYKEKHQIKLYSFVIQGSHDHKCAQFPLANRAGFERDFKARIAEGVRKYVPQFLGGPVFERRYTTQILPLAEDVEDKFFYCALQAVQDGLCERISEYPGYNSFHDAIWGVERTYKVVRWGEYFARKRSNPELRVEEFTEEYVLRYERLPGYEQLSQKEYAQLMLEKLEERRVKIVNEWKAKGHVFMTKEQLRRVIPGSLPRNRKQGIMRPIVLSTSLEVKKQILEWYFGIVSWYREASSRFRSGELTIEFPPFTYRPVSAYTGPP